VNRADMQEIVDAWQERLQLAHYVLKIDWEKTLEDDFAEIDRHFGYATIRFNAGFGRWSRDVANRTVVHELMHLVTADLDAFEEGLEKPLGSLAYSLLHERYNHEIEAVVDRLATLFVDLAGEV
jgi:hypothetical protein